MTILTRSEIVELIRRIQSGEGDNEVLKTLERATGIPNVWVIFDVLELEGMVPDKVFELISGYHVIPSYQECRQN
jgi:hypothetical protein